MLFTAPEQQVQPLILAHHLITLLISLHPLPLRLLRIISDCHQGLFVAVGSGQVALQTAAVVLQTQEVFYSAADVVAL